MMLASLVTWVLTALAAIYTALILPILKDYLKSCVAKGVSIEERFKAEGIPNR